MSALVLVANGTEEMEAVISIDVLRRAGVDVVVASVGPTGAGGSVECSRKVRLLPDFTLEEASAKEFDVILLPGGGPGAKAFAASAEVGALLKKQEEAGKWIAAVCASPTVLKAHNVAKGKNITSYPAFKTELEGDYKYHEDEVVQDGKLITSRGPGTSFAFALKVAENLVGSDKVKPLPDQMILN